jgi:branched-chain amino acid transport system substrate-binding protein
MKGHIGFFCIAAVVLLGCSTSFSPLECREDDECGKGTVCDVRDDVPVCVKAEDATITIGQSAPVSGTNQALGTEMKLGIELAFAEKNAAGGVRGRKLKLAFRDDAYSPDLAQEAAMSLVDAQVMTDVAPRCPTTSEAAVKGEQPVSSTALERGPNAVLAFLGNVGTPTMVRTAPVAIETGTLFFGAFTGAATILRDQRAADCGRFIFNVRASYQQEARATMEYFKHKGVKDHQHVLSFDQSDSFGQAGYDGLVAAYRDVVGEFPEGLDDAQPIVRFRYIRNDDTSVPAQAALAAKYLAGVLREDTANHSVGVMMTDTYGAAATFITELRKWQFADDAEQEELDKAKRLSIHFSNVSFVGPNALSDRLVAAGTIMTPTGKMPLTQDVLVSQVVPNYQSDSSEIVKSYNRLIEEGGHTPSFTSLEGYVTARVFVAGLEAHKGPFDPDALVDTFENLPDLSFGIGAASGFTRDNHQYSNSVWGTLIRPDGRFENLYFWSAGTQIEFFE